MGEEGEAGGRQLRPLGDTPESGPHMVRPRTFPLIGGALS